jgi:hypothetical protein
MVDLQQGQGCLIAVGESVHDAALTFGNPNAGVW